MATVLQVEDVALGKYGEQMSSLKGDPYFSRIGEETRVLPQEYQSP